MSCKMVVDHTDGGKMVVDHIDQYEVEIEDQFVMDRKGERVCYPFVFVLLCGVGKWFHVCYLENSFH